MSLTKGGSVDRYSVNGQICVTNQGTGPTRNLAISETVQGLAARGKYTTVATAAVNVSGHPVLAAGETNCYPYDIAFIPTAGASYRNQATVSALVPPDRKLKSFISTRTFAFPASPASIHGSVTVTDSNSSQWTFTDTGSQSYPQEFTDAGTFTNTAIIVETGQLASATVAVTQSAFCETVWDAVAYWCFDDQVSPTADGAGDHDATLIGALFNSEEVAPTSNVAALSLDGINDYAGIPDSDPTSNLDGLPALTVAAWVRPDTINVDQSVVMKYNSNVSLPSYYLMLRSGSQFELGVSGTTGTSETTSLSGGIQAGVWTHIVGVWRSSGGVTLFLNGVQVATRTLGTFPIALRDTTTPVNIGALEAISDGSRPFFYDGLIDEVYIFGRALSGTEIADLAAGTW